MTSVPQPTPCRSGSINNGADLLLSLIETEKANALAEARHDFNDLQTRFAQFRNAVATTRAEDALRCQHANVAASTVREELSKMLLDLAQASEEAKEAKKAAAQAMKDLEQLKSALAAVGISYTDANSLVFCGEWAAVIAELAGKKTTVEVTEGDSGKTDILSVNPTSFLEIVQKNLEDDRTAEAKRQKKYSTVMKDHDRLRVGSQEQVVPTGRVSIQATVERPLKRPSSTTSDSRSIKPRLFGQRSTCSGSKTPLKGKNKPTE